MRGKILLWLALSGALLVASLGLKLAIHYYAKSLEMRLNPAHADLSAKDNRQWLNHIPGIKRLVLFGDSRMQMWKPLPHVAGHEIINRGVGGDTTAQLLLRLQRDVIDLNPDVVVIQIGINDLKAIGVMPEKKERIIRQVKSNIQQMALQLNEHGIHLLLMTVLPAAEPDVLRRFIWSAEIDRAVAAINIYIRALASAHVSIIDCSPLFDVGDTMRLEFALDTLHLNANGYEALGKLLETSFMTMAVSKPGAQN